MTSKTFLYFAYGSNLWSKRIHENNPSAIMRHIALLKDYKLEFAYMANRWKGAVANILPVKGSQIYGILWEIDMADLNNLDRQEGVPVEYERVELNVEKLSGGNVTCMAYKLRNETREHAINTYGVDKLKPSQRYKNVIICGAKEHNLPEEYIEYLESLPDNGYNGEIDVNIPLV